METQRNRPTVKECSRPKRLLREWAEDPDGKVAHERKEKMIPPSFIHMGPRLNCKFALVSSRIWGVDLRRSRVKKKAGSSIGNRVKRLQPGQLGEAARIAHLTSARLTILDPQTSNPTEIAVHVGARVIFPSGIFPVKKASQPLTGIFLALLSSALGILTISTPSLKLASI